MSTRVFYVSVVDGHRSGLLLGPFVTHAEALEQVEPVRAWVLKHDDRAHFYAFGTTSTPGTMSTARPGRLNGAMSGFQQIAQLNGGPVMPARQADSAAFEPAHTVVRLA